MYDELEKFTDADTGCVAVIVPDNDGSSESPRNWDNITTFLLQHRRYDLPWEDTGFSKDDSLDELTTAVAEKFPDALIVTIRGYEHGDLTLSVSAAYPFTDPWDSGIAGIAFMPKPMIDENFDGDRERAYECIKAELDTYNMWATGDVYGVIVTMPDGMDTDSCYGFYGLDDATDNAKSMLAAAVANVKYNYGHRVATEIANAVTHATVTATLIRENSDVRI